MPERAPRYPSRKPFGPAPVEAWHLPGEAVADDAATVAGGAGKREEWHEGRTAGGAPFRSPRLSAERAAAVAVRVREAALDARLAIPTRAVIRKVAAAARELADPESTEGARVIDLLGRELGWAAGLAEETLRGMAESWTEEALLGLVESEVADISVLDGFVPDPARPHRRRRAAGPPLLLQIQAGNVPGAGVTGVLRGLLVRSGVLVKLPEDEPGLTVLFARSLARRDPLLGRSVAAVWWPGGEEPAAWTVWVKRAGKVVVYGGEEAVRGVRAAAPASVDVLAYGPRLGIAVLLAPGAAGGPGTVALDLEAAARALAGDVCAYEQQGCVSPRLAYIVGTGPEPFAALLAEALAREVARIPRPVPGPAEATAIRSARAAAEFAGYAPGRQPTGVLGADDLSWTVVWSGEATSSAETLPRFLRVGTARDLPELLDALAPLEGRIQALGYAAPPGSAAVAELAEGAARLGVSRVAPLGRIAWPPADWRQDGRHQLLPLLSWTDWEG